MSTLLAIKTFEELAAGWLPMLLDASIKGVVILGLAGTATLVMRRASATTRHLVWMFAFVGLLILPVLSASLPGWQILPKWVDLQSQDAVPPMLGDDAVGLMAPELIGESGYETPTAVAPPPAIEALPAGYQNEPSIAVTEAASEGVSVWSVITWIWLFGFLVSLAPLVLGKLSLWHLKRSSRAITDGSWLTLFRRASGELGLDRPVEMLASDRRSMPMVWGIFKPKLLLPSDTSGWSVQRRWVVLLHELGHVRRWDCLSKLICQIACSVYWFNPLAWVAFKRLQAEGERACDDLVLNAGSKPGDYAEHILQIASGLEAKLFAAHSGIAMARPSKLEGRLLAILDSKRNRRAWTRIGILAATILVAGLVAITATLKASPGGGETAAPVRKEAATESTGNRPSLPPTLEEVRRLVARNEALTSLVKMDYTARLHQTGERPQNHTGKRRPGRRYTHFKGVWAQDGPKQYCNIERYYSKDELARSSVRVIEGNMTAELAGKPGSMRATIRETSNHDLADIDPVQLGIRPFEAQYPLSKILVQEFASLHDKTEIIDGQEAYVIDAKRPLEPTYYARIWIDRERGMPLHIEYYDKHPGAGQGRLLSEIKSIKLHQLPNGGWIPVEGIRSVHFSTWVSHKQIVVNMDSIKVRRKDIPESLFTVFHFGPVIERTVYDGSDGLESIGKDIYIDLDTARVISQPPTFLSREAGEKWRKESGIDAMASMDPRLRGFISRELIAKPVPATEWDIEPSAIRGRLGSEKLGPVTMRGTSGLPATFLFKTREGGMGILQIVGFSKKPKGVKIRYKMVQQVQLAKSATGPVELPVRKVVTSEADTEASIAIDCKFFKVPAEADAQITQWHLKQFGIPVGKNLNSSDLSSDDAKSFIAKMQSIKDVEVVVATQLTMLNGKGAAFFDGQDVSLYVSEDQEAKPVYYEAGTYIEFTKVETSADALQIAFGLVAKSNGEFSLNKAEQFEVEMAKYEGKVSVPIGQTLLLRSPFIKTQIVAVPQAGNLSKEELQRANVVETPIPNGKPEAYWYVLIKPAMIDKADAEKPVRKTFALKHADAEKMTPQIEKMISGMRVSYQGRLNDVPKVTVMGDTRRNTITVITDADTMEKIRRFIQEADTPIDSGVEKVVKKLDKPGTEASKKLTFGPVIEREIPSAPTDGKEWLIDFDTGEIISITHDEFAKQVPTIEGANAYRRWYRKTGMDAVVRVEEPFHGLLGIELVVVPTEDTDGLNLKPDAVVNSVSELQPDAVTLRGETPLVYKFKTREGGMGILQIVGFTENPKGVKIRYKMVQSVKSKSNREEVAKGLPRVYELKYADADYMAKRIMRLYAGEARKVRVVPVRNKQRNAIVVLTDQETMKEIAAVIEKLDRPVNSETAE